MPEFIIKFGLRVISGIYLCDDIIKKVSDIMSTLHLGAVKEVSRKGSLHTFIVFPVADGKDIMTFIEWWRALVPMVVSWTFLEAAESASRHPRCPVRAAGAALSLGEEAVRAGAVGVAVRVPRG